MIGQVLYLEAEAAGMRRVLASGATSMTQCITCLVSKTSTISRSVVPSRTPV